ncbi:hypothetical protein QFC22_006245 [Naganishia vaughanmartiniae]|uniref:Uncharacterized protein n=1 Tax=Naganishia vaughanmartiniae TaxID=1424756 RepID=A0ACC2WM01_9TREE|nr:hypothetical protein QFC22_006245 [Naganishia vaughanmartiniae]
MELNTINDELNGTVYLDKVYYHNLRWAGNMAKVILQEEQKDKGFPFSLKVLTVVAEVLAGDNDLSTLARLNRASRSVHEGTLPILYETVKFDHEQAVERSVGLAKINKGFVYTNSTLGINTILRKNSHLHPIYVTLYKTLQLHEVLRACLPRGENTSNAGVTFFGTHYYYRPKNANRTLPRRFRDIIGITIKRSTCLDPAKEVEGMEGWHAAPRQGNLGEGRFHLKLEDDVVDEEAKRSIGRVLDHLAIYTRALSGSQKAVSLDLKCSSKVFERFIQSRYTQALAEAFSLYWRHRPLQAGVTFLKLNAPSDRMLPQYRGADIFEGETGQGWAATVGGKLVFGHADVNLKWHLTGFSARVIVTLAYEEKANYSHTETVWSQGYPLAYIPLETPSAEEMQRAEPHTREMITAALARAAISSNVVPEGGATSGGRLWSMV